MPVSSGKTRSSRLVIERLLRPAIGTNGSGRTRRELVERRCRGTNPPGSPRPCRQCADAQTRPLRVFSRDTLSRREIAPRDKCFLVVDEATASWVRAGLVSSPRLRGSATASCTSSCSRPPYRLDGKPLSNVADVLIEPGTPGRIRLTTASSTN